MKNCLIVLNYNDYQTTSKFINNVKNYDNIDKIVVVDNNSSDKSYEKLVCFKSDKIHVIKSDKNGGYSYGNNIGVKYAIEHFNPEYIIISNPDVVFEDDVIIKMMDVYDKYNNIGIVAPRMIDRSNQACCWKMPKYYLDLLLSSTIISRLIGNPYRYKDIEISSDINYVDILAGSFFMIKSEVIKEIEYMDEDVFLYCEEAIMSHKLLSKKYKNILLGNEKFIHEHSVSINKSIQSRVKQHKILFDSKIVYHMKYSRKSNFKISMMKLIFKLGLLEKNIIFKFKDLLGA